MIPLFPSGLYFEEGLVINSTCFIDAEGICCNNCPASIFVGFPSIKTLTLLFPRKLNSFVCGSIFTVGMLLKISDAVVPEAIKSLPIVTTFLSAFCSIVERSFIIETVSIVLAFCSKVIFPKLISLFSSVKVIFLEASKYPIKLTFKI